MTTKRLRKLALWGVLCVIIALLLAVFLPIPPHGRFSTPNIGNTAHAYLEFSGGKVSTVVFGGDHGREGPELRDVVGEYRKEHGRWVMVMQDGSTGHLCATLLSLTLVSDKGEKDGPYYRYEIYSGR